mgnify:CR=1 FL=1|jgi:hypothetical protein
MKTCETQLSCQGGYIFHTLEEGLQLLDQDRLRVTAVGNIFWGICGWAMITLVR